MGFLIGRRKAILAIAAEPRAVWLGLLFVLSAGLAREYDGEYLLAEPWHLALPLGASLVTSFVLYLAVRLIDKPLPEGVSFWGAYRAFLGLSWMTAPLAWLYAIPVERFFSPGVATECNLWLLAIVAAWRVLLITRVISVVWGYPYLVAIWPVMLFADGIALTAIQIMPVPVFAVMGGVRLTESEQVIQNVTMSVFVLGVLSLPIWILGTFIVLVFRFRDREAWRWTASVHKSQEGVSRGLLALGAAAIVAWVAVLPFTQREQRHRWLAERDLENGRIAEALRFLWSKSRGDFPPHWDPPPRIGYGESHPPLLDVLDALAITDAAPWVREMFLEKLDFQIPAEEYAMQNESVLSLMPDDRFERYMIVLRRLPEGSQLAHQHLEEIQRDEDYIKNYGPHDQLPRDDAKAELARKKRLELYHALRSLANSADSRASE